MLDLNSVTLSSILNMNVQDGSDTDVVSVLSSDDQQDDNNSELDPGAFVLLFAEIASNIQPPEKKDNSGVAFSGMEEPQKSIGSSEDPLVLNTEENVLNSVEENVAVAWINSEYYQSEITPHDFEQVNELVEYQSQPIESNALKAVEVIEPEIAPQTAAISFNTQEVNPSSDNLEALQNVEQTNLLTNNIVFESEKIEQETKVDPDEVPVEFHLEKSAENSLQIAPKHTQKPSIQNNNQENNLNKAPVTDADKNNEFIKAKPDFDSKIQSITLDGHGTKPIEQFVDNHMNQISVNMMQPHFIGREEAVQNTAETPVLLSIPTDVDHPQWSKQFSEHVIWMGQQGIKNAVIKVHPEDLGPLEINIQVINDSASVNIASHSQHVRDIIDQSMPQLQKMMEDQGLSLSEFNVDSEPDKRQFEQERNKESEQVIRLDDEAGTSIPTPVKHKTMPQGVIDYFA